MIMLNYDYIIKLRPFVRARGALYIRSYYDSYMIYMILEFVEVFPVFK